MPLSAFHGPVIAVIDQPESAGLCGRAKPAAPMCAVDGKALRQTLRLVLLECLLVEAKNLRNQRKSKEASDCEAQLRALRLEIYRAGLTA